MPDNRKEVPRSAGRTFFLWLFLTFATSGFATTIAGIYFGSAWLVGAGLTVFAFAGLLFMYVQFWSTVAQKRTPANDQWLETTPQDLGRMVAAEVAQRRAEEANLVEFLQPDDTTVVRAPSGRSMSESMPDLSQGQWPEATQRVFDQRRVQPQSNQFKVPPAFQRRDAFTQAMPIVRSVFDPADEEQPAPEEPTQVEGKVRGQCGGCGTFIWAPKQRPIRLRCPKCRKVSLLTA